MKDHWLSNRLKELGKKSRGLAQHLGVADSRITEIKKGLREIQTDELVREHFETVWLPQKARQYFTERDPKALAYLPKLLPAPTRAA